MTTNDLIHRLVTRLLARDVVAYDWPESGHLDAWACSLCDARAERECATHDLNPLPLPDPFPHADDCPYRLAGLLAARLGLEVTV